ncbi:MAG: hypothetical protein JWN60_2649 [Acidobacteria bacterium]|nr:hypothetical protein [Acidobacteriota bacterium]
MPNTPNPDVNSPVTGDNSSAETDIEREDENGSENQEMPVPPDSRPNAPIEEPPDTRKAPIDENRNEPTRLV